MFILLSKTRRYLLRPYTGVIIINRLISDIKMTSVLYCHKWSRPLNFKSRHWCMRLDLPLRYTCSCNLMMWPKIILSCCLSNEEALLNQHYQAILNLFPGERHYVARWTTFHQRWSRDRATTKWLTSGVSASCATSCSWEIRPLRANLTRRRTAVLPGWTLSTRPMYRLEPETWLAV